MVGFVRGARPKRARFHGQPRLGSEIYPKTYSYTTVRFGGLTLPSILFKGPLNEPTP